MRYRVKFLGKFTAENGRSVKSGRVWFITVDNRQELLNELESRLPGLHQIMGPVIGYQYRVENL